MNTEPKPETREQLMARYGISPTVARAYIEHTHRASIEDIVAHGGLRSHKMQALLEIATKDDGLYLLEDVYEVIREEFEAKERAEREASGFSMVVDVLNETNHGRWRLAELRAQSEDIIAWHESLAES